MVFTKKEETEGEREREREREERNKKEYIQAALRLSLFFQKLPFPAKYR